MNMLRNAGLAACIAAILIAVALLIHSSSLTFILSIAAIVIAAIGLLVNRYQNSP